MLSFSRQAASSMQMAMPLYTLFKIQFEIACSGICFLKIDKEINTLKDNDMIILTIHNALCVSNRTWKFFVEFLVLMIPHKNHA